MIDKPEEYKGRYEIINGKRVLVVQAKSEEIVHPDGRKSVIIKVPAVAVKMGANQ